MPEDEQNLPPDVAMPLAPKLRHALESPPRRRILRALNTTTDAQTLVDISQVVPAASTSTLNYHVLILEKDGCIAETCQIFQGNSILRAYESKVAGNQAVIEVLRTTEHDDEGIDGG